MLCKTIIWWTKKTIATCASQSLKFLKFFRSLIFALLSLSLFFSRSFFSVLQIHVFHRSSVCRLQTFSFIFFQFRENEANVFIREKLLSLVLDVEEKLPLRSSLLENNTISCSQIVIAFTGLSSVGKSLNERVWRSLKGRFIIAERLFSNKQNVLKLKFARKTKKKKEKKIVNEQKTLWQEEKRKKNETFVDVDCCAGCRSLPCDWKQGSLWCCSARKCHSPTCRWRVSSSQSPITNSLLHRKIWFHLCEFFLKSKASFKPLISAVCGYVKEKRDIFRNQKRKGRGKGGRSYHQPFLLVCCRLATAVSSEGFSSIIIAFLFHMFTMPWYKNRQ